jgi:CheY-like chemotaxis protein
MPALRILVIEDETMIADLLAELLVGMGHEVCGVEGTKASAILAAARCRPDLMIVDALLHDDDGISTVAEIARAGPIPHLFISGDLAKVRALRPDAVAISKPFRKIDLARAISRALGSAAAV